MKPWLAILLFVVLVLGPIAVGGLLLQRAYAFDQRALQAQGQVVSIDRVRNQQSGDYDTVATVAWKDRKGGAHTLKIGGAYAKGDAVTVRYDPDDPSNTSTGGGGYVAGSIVLFIGLSFLFIVLRAWWRSRRGAAGGAT